MKIALVHDYLSQDGGAEKVLEAFHEIWPDAPIFVLFHDRDSIDRFHHADVRESWLARIPLSKRKYQWLLPLMPLATRSYDLSHYDVVLSSVSAFAKGVRVPRGALHISYCHTPTRYLWSDSQEYLRDLRVPFFIKWALSPVLDRLRIWDRQSTSGVDIFVANSQVVRDRISRYYERESRIIFPPVDVHKFAIADDVGDYFVTGGRLVSYKRMDLVVHVFNRLGLRLKIFGSGAELRTLQKNARDNIEFLGRISDEEKAVVIAGAKAFIHPQVEDLGITPIEAMASGRPVIAFRGGGVVETIIDGKTGVFFEDQTWESLLDAVIRFEERDWNSIEIREHAEQFGLDKFKDKIKKMVEEEFMRYKNISV